MFQKHGKMDEDEICKGYITESQKSPIASLDILTIIHLRNLIAYYFIEILIGQQFFKVESFFNEQFIQKYFSFFIHLLKFNQYRTLYTKSVKSPSRSLRISCSSVKLPEYIFNRLIFKESISKEL